MTVVDITFNSNLIILAFGLAFLGTYVAICLAEQLRSSYLHGDKDKLWIRLKWLVAIGISFGGVGMWSVEQIILASMHMQIHNFLHVIHFKFNFRMIIISLVICCLLVCVGVFIASSDHLFAKSKAEIIESFVSQTKKLSMTEIRQTKDSKVIWIISTNKLSTLFLGGTIAAIGIIIMHYINLNSLIYDESLSQKRDYGITFAGVLVAWFGCIIGFWILFRLCSIFPSREKLRLFSSFMLTATYVGTFYIIIKSITFTIEQYDNVIDLGPSDTLDQDLIMVPAFIILWIFIFYSLADSRRLIYKYRNYIQQHQLNQGTNNKQNNPLETSRFKRHTSRLKVLPSSINNIVSPIGSNQQELPTFKYKEMMHDGNSKISEPDLENQLVSSLNNNLESDTLPLNFNIKEQMMVHPIHPLKDSSENLTIYAQTELDNSLSHSKSFVDQTTPVELFSNFFRPSIKEIKISSKIVNIESEKVIEKPSVETKDKRVPQINLIKSSTPDDGDIEESFTLFSQMVDMKACDFMI